MIEFIPIDIYINTIVIAAGIDEKEFDVLYEDNKDKFTYDEYQTIRNDIANDKICDGSTCLLDCGNIFVYIRKGRERHDLTVAHELLHAVNKLLCRAGVNHDADAEPWAYLLGWLTNEYYIRLDDYESNNNEKQSTNTTEYKTFILKENSEEIREKIKDAGIDVCLCASFKDACWLDYSTRVNNGVHGVGYYDSEMGTHSQEEELARFEAECENPIYCKDVDEFVKLINDFKNGKAK